MKKTLKHIDFNEALERVRNGERVYAFDLSSERLTLKLFNRLEVSETIKTDYAYFIVVEVAG